MAVFGDIRVEASAERFLDAIAATGSLVLRRAGGGRADEMAAHRLLSSPHASIDAVIDTLSARAAHAGIGREVLVVQDTTEVNFSGRSGAREGFGPGGDGRTPGFFIHAALAADAQSGAILGISGAAIWTRTGKPKAHHSVRAPGDKESIRWLDGARRAGQVFAGAARVTVVGDRESDMFHLFAARPAGVELIVRAAHDRALEDGGRLFAALAQEPALETRIIVVGPRGPGERAREAQIEVRARRVSVTRPVTLRHEALPETVELTLVEAREIAPPPGKKPVLWRLLSSAPRSPGEIADLYRRRWRIEELFRTLKSGLGLPDTQIHGAQRVFMLAAFALGGAARILQLVDARDGGDRPATDVLDAGLVPVVAAISDTLEGATLRQKNPHAPGSLAHVAWVCARLGGWNCYYKPPGPKTMNTGWNVLAQRLSGYLLGVKAKNP